MNVDLERVLTAERENLFRLLDELASEVPDQEGTLPPPMVVRGTAGILHDYYCGVERMFRRIASACDDPIDNGSACHA